VKVTEVVLDKIACGWIAFLISVSAMSRCSNHHFASSASEWNFGTLGLSAFDGIGLTVLSLRYIRGPCVW
jgi:hypothetical protein